MVIGKKLWKSGLRSALLARIAVNAIHQNLHALRRRVLADTVTQIEDVPHPTPRAAVRLAKVI